MTCSGGDSAQGADEAQLLGVTLPPLTPRRWRGWPNCCRRRRPPPTRSTTPPMIWAEVEALAELVVALGADPAFG